MNTYQNAINPWSQSNAKRKQLLNETKGITSSMKHRLAQADRQRRAPNQTPRTFRLAAQSGYGGDANLTNSMFRNEGLGLQTEPGGRRAQLGNRLNSSVRNAPGIVRQQGGTMNAGAAMSLPNGLYAQTDARLAQEAARKQAVADRYAAAAADPGSLTNLSAQRADQLYQSAVGRDAPRSSIGSAYGSNLAAARARMTPEQRAINDAARERRANRLEESRRLRTEHAQARRGLLVGADGADGFDEQAKRQNYIYQTRLAQQFANNGRPDLAAGILSRLDQVSLGRSGLQNNLDVAKQRGADALALGRLNAESNNLGTLANFIANQGRNQLGMAQIKSSDTQAANALAAGEALREAQADQLTAAAEARRAETGVVEAASTPEALQREQENEMVRLLSSLPEGVVSAADIRAAAPGIFAGMGGGDEGIGYEVPQLLQSSIYTEDGELNGAGIQSILRNAENLMRNAPREEREALGRKIQREWIGLGLNQQQFIDSAEEDRYADFANMIFNLRGNAPARPAAGTPRLQAEEYGDTLPVGPDFSGVDAPSGYIRNPDLSDYVTGPGAFIRDPALLQEPAITPSTVNNWSSSSPLRGMNVRLADLFGISYGLGLLPDGSDASWSQGNALQPRLRRERPNPFMRSPSWSR